MLNVVSARRSSSSPEKFTRYAPNNGLMEAKRKDKFQGALGLSPRIKTFGIDLEGIKNLYNEADGSIRNQLKSKGLFLARLLSDEAKNFRKMSSTVIDLGPLYNNNEIAFELTDNEKVSTSFVLNIESEPTVFRSVSELPVEHVNFYSATYATKIINSLPEEYLSDLMKRKKGLIIQTQRDGKRKIPSPDCLIYELTVDESNGVEINYRSASTNTKDSQILFDKHTLVTIIHE